MVKLVFCFDFMGQFEKYFEGGIQISGTSLWLFQPTCKSVSVTVYIFFISNQLILVFAIIRATAPVCAKFLSILQKKHIFSILHIHYYKTPTLVYLFYYLFYLNNNISLIFYYIKQTITHMAPPTFFFLCCERATWRGEKKKRIKKSFAHKQ